MEEYEKKALVEQLKKCTDCKGHNTKCNIYRKPKNSVECNKCYFKLLIEEDENNIGDYKSGNGQLKPLNFPSLLKLRDEDKDTISALEIISCSYHDSNNKEISPGSSATDDDLSSKLEEYGMHIDAERKRA
ncbi:hypothetical protein JW949_00310 [Candidatus Woesearchaeota archaeon]|nr:hypothetical protein [Candidatus Woesearchaeota archaeon]